MDSLSVSSFIKDYEEHCSKVQHKHFKRNETITTYIAKRNQVCILVSR